MQLANVSRQESYCKKFTREVYQRETFIADFYIFSIREDTIEVNQRETYHYEKSSFFPVHYLI